MVTVVEFLLIAGLPLQAVEPPDMAVVLAWISAGPGAVIVAGHVISHLLEWFSAWGLVLTGFWRGAVVVGLSLAFAFGAYFLLRAPPEIAGVQPHYTIAVLTILDFASTQRAFPQQKGAGDLSRPKSARVLPGKQRSRPGGAALASGCMI